MRKVRCHARKECRSLLFQPPLHMPHCSGLLVFATSFCIVKLTLKKIRTHALPARTHARIHTRTPARTHAPVVG